MKSTVENLSPTRVRLAVEVPFDVLKPSLDAAYKQIAGSIRVPGFRPGKVPARIIDQRVGRDAVLQEAVNSALPGLSSDAVREHELQPAGQPEVDISDLSDGESLSFTAEVDIRPEITLPELDGIEVSVDDVEVSDEDVTEQLDGLRARFGTLTAVERPVQSGDFVALDLVATVDGEPVEAGTAKGISYEVGSGDLVDGLDEAIIGKSAGETSTFSSTLQQGEHAGTEADVAATVNSVKERELPDADDDFAQLASEFDTIDELTEDLRTRLQRVKALEQGAQARDRVLEKLVDSIEFPLPDSAVQAEVEFREHDIIHSLGHDDEAYERYLAAVGQTRDEYLAELREAAEKNVRAQFVLDAVAEKTEVQVGDTELTEYLVRQSSRYGLAPQEFANQVVQGGNLPALVADVRRNKALASLLESAVVTDASGNTVDLNALQDIAIDDIDDVDDIDDDIDGADDAADVAQDADETDERG